MAPTNRRSQNNNERLFYQTPMFKLLSKLGLTMLVIVVVLTLVQCTIKSPETPSWTTQMTVPVVYRTYDMPEILDRIGQEDLYINDSGEVVISISKDLDTVWVDDDVLVTDDLNYSIFKELGPIAVDPPQVDPVAVYFDAIGLSVPLPGDSAIVPDTSFTTSSNLPTVTEFTTATFADGAAEIRIDNRLGLSLDNVTVDLIDGFTDQVITSGSYAGVIPSGSVQPVTLDLTGHTLPSELKIVSGYHTSGGWVMGVSGRYLTTSVVFDDTLTVSQATAQIPALARSDSAAVALAETDRIDAADMESGTLALSIVNNTDLDADVDILVPDLEDAFGAPFSADAVSVPRGQTSVLNYDLAGWTLAPSAGSLPQELTVHVDASSPGSGTEQRAVSETDSFEVTADLTNLRFGSVTGLFQSVAGTFDDVSLDIDVPTGFENLHLVDAVLTLEVSNGLDLPGAVDIQLNGDNGENVTIAGDITPAGLAASATSEIVNNQVADFLFPMPTRIDASGTVTFGDGAYVGTVAAGDFLFARIHIDAPLEVMIDEATIETDVSSEEIDQQDIDIVTEHFVTGRFVYRLINHLPIGAHINVFIDADSLNLDAVNAQLSFDSLFINSAPTDVNGVAIDTAATPEQVIMLDSLDIRILENETVYIGTELVLHGSNGEVIKLTGNDYLTAIGRIEVEYLFDGEF